jgi:predicted phosphodiesterase
MRIAIISDIHSNLEALKKALELIEKLSIDEIICLGDIVGYGANPNECIELVRRYCTSVIKGNHDAAVLNVSITENFNDQARSAVMWTRAQLTEKNLNYLHQLPLLNTRNDFLFVHSSPCEPSEWEYIFNEFDAMVAFRCFSQKICFIGHSHTPVIFSSTGEYVHRITKDERYIVNVGSVGQPRDLNPQLSFGVFDTDTWRYENIRGPYDVELAVKKILATDLPSMLGHRLLMGM